MLKRLEILSLLVLFYSIAKGQNEVDALRYSQFYYGGTSRYIGASGAFGAVGGDLSVVSINPAGIGIYRGSEFSFSPSLASQSTTSKYFGNASEDGKINFNFNNIGVVLAELKDDNDQFSQWKATQLAFTYNRLNNFNNRISISGINPKNSLLDQYVAQIKGTNPGDMGSIDPFGASLAWNTFLINPVDSIDSTSYSGVVSYGGARQRKSITTSGGISEISISIGGNYGDKLYIGGAFAFPIVNYSEESEYSENDESDTIAYISSYRMGNTLVTSGSGFNFKFGMIYRAADWFRIGGAIHTPTFYKLSDEYQSEMTSYFDSVPVWSSSLSKEYSEKSPEGHFDYRLITPGKLLGSLAFILGKQGLISADYEIIDYSSARLRSTGYSFESQNEAIDQKYTYTTNLRVGTEWRFMPFSIRGGYAIYGSPYKNGLNDGAKSSYSIGFGIKEKGFFIDFAYIFTQSTEDYYLYNPEIVSTSVNKTKSHGFQSTLGFRF